MEEVVKKKRGRPRKIQLPEEIQKIVDEVKEKEDQEFKQIIVEEKLKRIIVSKKVWKMYYCYCYSILTDNLPIDNQLTTADNLKAEKIISVKNRVN